MSIPLAEHLYTYKAVVLRWVDGDTVELRVDLGFKLWMECTFRLSGIDTPERGKTNYKEATEFASTMAPPHSELIIRTHKADKYGRWLAELFVGPESVNVALVASGLAVVYDGGARVVTMAYYENGEIVEEREGPAV